MKRGWHQTLSFRLALALALLTACMAGLMGVLAYRTMAVQLSRSDEVALLGKLRQVRALLAQAASPRLLLEQPQYLRDTMSGEGNAIVRISDASGRLLLDINPRGLVVPQPAPLELEQEPAPAQLLHWRGPDGTPAATVAARGQLGAGREAAPLTITVARVFHERTAILRAFRERILLLVTLGALGVALLVALWVWQRLTPLRRLATQADGVRIDRLSQRLDPGSGFSELDGLVRSSNAMLDRLQQGFERLSQFAGDLAHELRTPLSNLHGQTQVVLSQPRASETYRQLLESNLEEFERLQRMTDSMLFLARADHGHVALNRQRLEVQAELHRQADYFQDLADEKGLSIEVQPVEAQAPRLQADPLLFRRALANLVSNAIRHADQPGVVTLQARPTAEGWHISISNPARPLHQEQLTHLFERFYRTDPAREGSAQGAGLGLSIVRSILQLHGGTVTVQQHTGGQISFELRWPWTPNERMPGSAERP